VCRKRPPLTVDQVLAWADAHHACTGQWPTRRSGPVIGAPGETWANVNQALAKGLRGLPRSSLACLLADYRGVRYRWKGSRLTVQQVVAWARAHRRRTGKWPTQWSGPIPEAPGETWQGAAQAGVSRDRPPGEPRGCGPSDPDVNAASRSGATHPPAYRGRPEKRGGYEGGPPWGCPSCLW
jgi:hypothetical protein